MKLYALYIGEEGGPVGIFSTFEKAKARAEWEGEWLEWIRGQWALAEIWKADHFIEDHEIVEFILDEPFGDRGERLIDLFDPRLYEENAKRLEAAKRLEENP